MSWLVRVLYVAILTGSAERIRSEAALTSSSVSSSAGWKQTDGGDERDAIAGKTVGAAADENELPLAADSDRAASSEKRKWGEKTMMTWGKKSSEPPAPGQLPSLLSSSRKPCAEDRVSRDRRRWGEKSMSAWGKRTPTNVADGDDCDDDASLAADEDVDKRKWGEKTMQVWGKRLSSPAVVDDEIEAQGAADKRKWGERSMSAWGKRRSATDEEVEEKRKWGSNSMMVWGKRDPVQGQWQQRQQPLDRWSHKIVRRGSGSSSSFDLDIDDDDDIAGQFREHAPASTRSVPYGGSSSGGGVAAAPARLKVSHRRFGNYWGPKRKWETNTMKVWGKRSSGGSDWRGASTNDDE